jgi:hypothetical protein
MLDLQSRASASGKTKRNKLTAMWHIAIALFVAVSIVLILIYPHRPDGMAGWLVLVAVAMPVVLGLQYIGQAAFESRLMSRLGKGGRIAAGVGVTGAICIVLFAIWTFGVSRLGVW